MNSKDPRDQSASGKVAIENSFTATPKMKPKESKEQSTSSEAKQNGE